MFFQGFPRTALSYLLPLYIAESLVYNSVRTSGMTHNDRLHLQEQSTFTVFTKHRNKDLNIPSSSVIDIPVTVRLYKFSINYQWI